MKVTTVQDLVDLAFDLARRYGSSTKICFSDRFNEYAIGDDFGLSSMDSDTIMLSCEKIGSALQGTHRVLGDLDNE